MAIPAAGYDYEADAKADGVLHYWPFFDPYTGVNCIDIISSETLVVYNDSVGATLAKAMFGYCRDLTANGTGGYHSVLVKEADSQNTGILYDWSFAMWFNPDALVTVDKPTLVDLTGNSGFKAYFDYPNSVDTLYIEFTDGLIAVMSLAVTPTNGANHLFIVTSNSTTGETSAYLDDALIATDANAAQSLSMYSPRWYIGDNSFAADSLAYFDGQVDEVVVFGKALDATDRATLWNAGAGMVDSLVKFSNKERVIHTETPSFDDTVKFNFQVVALDIISSNASSHGALVAIAKATDTPDVSNVVAATVRALPIAVDGVALIDAYIGNMRGERGVVEGFGFITSFSVDGEVYDGVVMNTQNSAVTEYDQVPYNSMAKIDTGVYAAAAGDGIYYMEGGLDDTANIDAYITTKLTNFGESKYKRVDRAYVAMSNDGPMVLKVITRNALGTLSEDWYELTNTSGTMRTDRFKLGKGLKSHYWQFTLTNKNGADFEISELNFKQLRLSRRV